MPTRRERNTGGATMEHQPPGDLEAEQAKEGQGPARRPPRPPAASRQRKGQPNVQVSQLELFDVVSKHSKATKLAVKEWAGRYPGDQAGATAELFTLLAKSCGCSYTVTSEEADEGAVDDLVQRISDRIMEEGCADPFTCKGAKSFKAAFEELWDSVVLEAHAREFLFDDYLMDKLVNLLTALSCSVIRPFRMAATVAATQLVTSWIHTMKTIMAARDTAQRQLFAEEKKNKASKGPDRVATLRRTLELSHKQSQDLQAVVSNLFQAVFAHRFRDVSAPIRTVVILGIGTWVHSLPAIYLKDQFLKYLAWALSDKDAEVRQAGVRSLIRLYQDERNVSPLEDFTERFSRRFVELIYDIDTSVAVLAVKLLKQVVDIQAVSKDKISEVYGLLIDQHHELRHSAAELAASQLEELGSAVMAKAPHTANAKQPTSGDKQLAGVLHVMRELSKDKEELQQKEREPLRGADIAETEAEPLSTAVVLYVVDALHDRAPVLTSWSTLTSALADDASQIATTATDNINLLHLLITSVRKSCGTLKTDEALSMLLRGKSDKQRKAKSCAAAQAEVTLVLMKVLPQLIRKFQSDPVQAATLVELAREMKLEMFIKKKDQKGFEELLDAVVAVFGKHTSSHTIQECVSTLNYCIDEGIQDRAELAVNTCLQEMMAKLKDGWGRLSRLSKANLASVVAAAEEGNVDPVLYSTQVALNRLYHLQSGCSQPLAGLEDLNNLLNKLLQSVLSGQAMTTGIIQYALLNRFMVLSWALKRLYEAPDDREAIGRFTIARDDFVKQLTSIGDRAHEPTLCSRVFEMQSDLYLLLGHALTSDVLPAEIGYTPTDDELIKYWALGRQIISFWLSGGSVDDAGDAEPADRCLPAAEVLIHASKLLTNGVVENPSWLSGQLVSYLVILGSQAKEVVNHLVAGLDREALPELYLDALQAAWGRAEDAEEHEHEQMAKQVQALSYRVMQLYSKKTPFNHKAVRDILQGGIRFVCLDLPGRVGFLGYGLGNFIGRLTPKDAAEMVSYLEQETLEPLQRCTDDEAVFVDNFKGHLQQRAEGETGTAPTPGDEEEGQAAEEFDEEMEVQPTEERLFVTPRETGAPGAKRVAESPAPEDEAPPRPRRRRL